jgi:hypothetical protein
MRNKDIFRSSIQSGHFPLTFNFVYRRDGRYIQCCYCGIYVYYRNITRDHVYPKSRGGTHKAPACVGCNIAKENMLPIEWAIHASERGLDFATIPIGAEYMQAYVDLLPTKYEMYQCFVSLLGQVIERAAIA